MAATAKARPMVRACARVMASGALRSHPLKALPPPINRHSHIRLRRLRIKTPVGRSETVPLGFLEHVVYRLNHRQLDEFARMVRRILRKQATHEFIEHDRGHGGAP